MKKPRCPVGASSNLFLGGNPSIRGGLPAMQQETVLDNHTDLLDNLPDLVNEKLHHAANLRGGDAGWPNGMANTYCNGSRVIEFHVKSRRVNGEPYNFCAIFHRPMPVENLDMGLWQGE